MFVLALFSQKLTDLDVSSSQNLGYNFGMNLDAIHPKIRRHVLVLLRLASPRAVPEVHGGYVCPFLHHIQHSTATAQVQQAYIFTRSVGCASSRRVSHEAVNAFVVLSRFVKTTCYFEVCQDSRCLRRGSLDLESRVKTIPNLVSR